MTDIEAALGKVLAEHESLFGSDDYTRCVCGAETIDLGGLRAHVVAVLLAVLYAWRDEQVADALAPVKALADHCERTARDDRVTVAGRGGLSEAEAVGRSRRADTSDLMATRIRAALAAGAGEQR